MAAAAASQTAASRAPEVTGTAAAASQRHQRTAAEFLVIGIGAAAGDLEAVQPIVAAVPAQARLCVVIAQQAGSSQRDLLGALSSSSPLRVREIEDGDELKPHVVFITPPHCDVEVQAGRLRLIPPTSQRAGGPSIDRLFASLAAEFGERAVGVILSGTGSDGAAGARSIKAAGGLVVVQDPHTACHDGMPRAALETGLADLSLSVERIGPALHALTEPLRSAGERASSESKVTFDSVVQLLTAQTGIPFTAYRRSTLHRRIKRRMAMHRCVAVNGCETPRCRFMPRPGAVRAAPL